jgi:hypothetical protein
MKANSPVELTEEDYDRDLECRRCLSKKVGTQEVPAETNNEFVSLCVAYILFYTSGAIFITNIFSDVFKQFELLMVSLSATALTISVLLVWFVTTRKTGVDVCQECGFISYIKFEILEFVITDVVFLWLALWLILWAFISERNNPDKVVGWKEKLKIQHFAHEKHGEKDYFYEDIPKEYIKRESFLRAAAISFLIAIASLLLAYPFEATKGTAFWGSVAIVNFVACPVFLRLAATEPTRLVICRICGYLVRSE